MSDRSIPLEVLGIAIVPLLTLWGIGSFGIWDPWELAVADSARELFEAGPGASTHTPLATWLIGVAFQTFGVGEWSGRLAGTIAGLLTCVLTFLLLRRSHGRRAGLIAVAVIASTPAFLLNARLLMGDAVELFAQAWVGVAAISASSDRVSARRDVIRYAFLALGLAVSTQASGVLLGPLPPIAAVAAWSLLSEDSGRGRGLRIDRWLVPALAALLVLGVLKAVAIDDPELSIWLGGGAVGGNPPTFDKAAELLFHGFAPWSAALPVAVIWVLLPRPTRAPEAQRVGWVLVLWSMFSLVAWTVYASRYGTPAHLALVPVAGLVAIWLNEVSSEPVARWPAAVVVGLLSCLLIRDYALYPESPLGSLAVDGLEVPEAYDAASQWAVSLATASALLVLMLVSHESIARPHPSHVSKWVRSQWNTGWAERAWIVLGTLVLGFCLSFGLMCFVLDLRIASVAVRIGRMAFFIPFVLAGLVFGLPWLRYAYGRLGDLRVVPALAGSLAVGAFVVFGFQAALSQHFSPKPVYDAYTRLDGGRLDPLASYQLPSTAARYYTDAPVEEIRKQADLLGFLATGGQRWAVIRADKLASLDRAHRRKTGEHLYVADARSGRLLLLAAKPIDGHPNQSFIPRHVLETVPAVQHAVGASFEDQIELVGYDLSLPEGDFVGAGQRFEVTWYWRVIGKAPPGYQVFVHIDGYGMRLNGDHVPVGGELPTKLWETGDVIADTQTLTVPASYRSGDYAIYVGLFRGSQRLDVKSGPDDGDDRVKAGVLRVR